MTNYTQKFNKIKKYMNNNNDNLVYLDGWYFPEKAVNHTKKINYFLNSYYDLNISSFLIMIRDNNSIKEVKKELLNDYKKYYALAWYDNFKAILKEV